jgi:hypothetical protein
MNNLHTYLNLCAEVYEISKPHVPRDAFAFYREYAATANGPILEPMCGTGRFLLPMLQEGFDIHGFDASHAMLSKLYEKANAKNLEPSVWHGFVQDLNRSEKYDLIFIPSGSFCLMAEEVEHVLDVFYNHLTDSGTLLFEVETMKSIPELRTWSCSLWPRNDGTTIRLSQYATFDEDIYKSLSKYELIRENQITNIEIEEYKIRIYEQHQLITMLKASGFKHIHVIKAFDINRKPNEKDESIVYECRK